jgi:hypothetical protein
MGAGIIAAVRWAAANLLVYALNLILTTETGMWALRYPDTNGLFVLEWAPDASRKRRRLNIAGSVGGVRVRFEDPAEAPAVVVASQRMDDDLGWRSLDPGELLHVDEKLNVTSTIAVDGPPARPLTRADLDPRAAASQAEDSRLPGEGAQHRAGKAVRKAEAGNGGRCKATIKAGNRDREERTWRWRSVAALPARSADTATRSRTASAGLAVSP